MKPTSPPSFPDALLVLATEVVRWRDLVEHSTDWVWEVDAKGVYTYASPRIKTLLGYEPEEVLGRTPFDLMAPGEAERIGEVFAAIVAERRPFALLENVNVHRDGHFVLIETSGVPLFDAAGELVGFRGIDRDVTARRLAEDGLLRFRWLAETTGDGVVVVRRSDGRVAHANAAAEGLFACAPGSSLVDRPLECLLPSVHAALVLQPDGPGGGRSTRFDAELVRDDQGRLHVELVAGLSAAGEEVLLLIRDRTHRVRRVAVDQIEARAATQALSGGSVGTMLRDAASAVVAAFDLVQATFRTADGVSETRVDGARAGPGQCRTFELGSSEEGLLLVEADDVSRLDSRATREIERVAIAVGTALVAMRQSARVQLFEWALAETANAVLIADRSGRVVWVNGAFTTLTGYSSQEIVGRNPRVLQGGLYSEAQYRELWATILSGEPWHGELFNRRKSGEVYPEEMTITPIRAAADEITHFIAMKSDISGRREQESRIAWAARHDALTRLPNRMAIIEDIGRVVAQALRGRPGALAILDLDWFKFVNDTMGHAAGDAFLVEVAGLFSGAVRPEDVVARLGGDEFVILFEGTSLEEAEAAVQRVHAATSTHTFHWGGHSTRVGVSVGLAAIDGALNATQLLARADTAMLAAKQHGRGRIVVLKTEADAVLARETLDETAGVILGALKEGRLSLGLRPVVRLADGQVEYTEALLCAEDREGRPLSAMNFVVVAERLGLADQLDCWVFDRALATLANDPGATLFIKVAASSLASRRWTAHVEQRLDAGNFSRGRLGMQVSEAAAVAHLSPSTGVLRRLANRGVTIAIDDFGSGETSILSLRALPVAYVKMDVILERNLCHDPEAQAVVQAIALVARASGKQVVMAAQGDPGVLPLLAELGVSLIQGHYASSSEFSPPVPSGR